MTPRPVNPPPGEPLPLVFRGPSSRLPAHVEPMRPTDGSGPFDDPRYFFEPWWPGIRAIAFVEGGRTRLRAEALADPMPAFPELAALPRLVRAEAAILDVTLMVLDARGRPSRTLLDRRLALGGERTGQRVEPGAQRGQRDVPPQVGSAAIVAADLLHLDGSSLAARPFGERRGELAALLDPSPWCLAGRGFVGDGTTVAEALGALGFRSLSARRLDAPLRRGPAGDAWYRVPVVAAVRELPPLLAVFRRLPL
jgi:bifunctional non-homologous end joining protein LigD